MSQKVTVGVVFGGKSAEHEVSVKSARNVVEAIDGEKYDVVLIGIDRQGRWYHHEDSLFLLADDSPAHIEEGRENEKLGLIPGEFSHQLITLSQHQPITGVDVIFPVLHGPFGEDGTMQGLLKLANIPFVGAGVLGSAVGMDKDVMKRLCRDAGIPNADFMVITRSNQLKIQFDSITARLGLPFFIKPSNLGSSVGVAKVKSMAEFNQAIETAFEYDHKVIVEECIVGREIECSVLGNEEAVASLPGEILPHHEFYSYEAKYIDDDGAGLIIPADLPPQIIESVQRMAIEAFQVLCCEGMARVDFFLQQDNQLIFNEINTIPGFTKISMYPKLWEVSGISYTELINRLIGLAIDRFRKDQALKTTFQVSR